MGIFVYASTASGKSTLAKKYSNVIDMDCVAFKYLNESGNNEERKSDPTRVLNPLWPQNYFDALEKVKDKYDYILIADDICNELLLKNHYEYWQVYPSLELKEEYMKRCIERGNKQIFIDNYSQKWESWHNHCKNDKYATRHIELKSGQYLEDVLPGLKKR